MEKISLSYAGRQISVAGWFVRAPNAQKGDSVSNNAKKVLFCLAAVFFIAFGVVTYRGYDKMTKYYNSGISSLNKTLMLREMPIIILLTAPMRPLILFLDQASCLPVRYA